jgi:hypothetical protein
MRLLVLLLFVGFASLLVRLDFSPRATQSARPKGRRFQTRLA